MIICPNCSTETFKAGQTNCASCSWEYREHDGLSDFFTTSDRENFMVEKYIDTYENLAKKNLENSNIDRRFLKNQAANLAKYISPIEGKYACDVGIGQGFLCDELLKRGVKKLAAIDVSSTYLRRFQNNDRVTPYLANAESLPFKDEFDLLVSTDVMEHVINVGSFLYSVNRSLKVGGMFAVRVPYREGLLNYSPHCGYNHDFGHLRSFNKDILRIYLGQAGFKVKSFHLDGFSAGTPHPYLYDSYRKKVIYNKIATFINTHLEHPADATLMNPYLARLVMKPVEIVAVAIKTRNLGD